MRCRKGSLSGPVSVAVHNTQKRNLDAEQHLRPSESCKCSQNARVQCGKCRKWWKIARHGYRTLCLCAICGIYLASIVECKVLSNSCISCECGREKNAGTCQ